MKDSADGPLHSAELARLAGVSTDTLRFYERSRLLPAAPRTTSGYRLFPPETVRRVKIVQHALSLGFSIKELATIFQERDGGGTPCQRVRALGSEKLAAMEAAIRELQARRRTLKKMLASWNKLLRKTPNGKHARLLETLHVPSRSKSPKSEGEKT